MPQGGEWAAIRFALQEQQVRETTTKSTSNIRIERPWGDVGQKLTSLFGAAFDRLEERGMFVVDRVHDEYALRVATYRCVVITTPASVSRRVIRQS